VSWPSLLDRLPSVRGRLIENASLADITWLRVGGPAQVLFLPADATDLARFLATIPHDIEVRVLGAGSNTLVRDGGVLRDADANRPFTVLGNCAVHNSWQNSPWTHVFKMLSQDPDNEYAMIDTTIVLSSQHSAGAKGSSKDKEAIGRSKGGLSRKIHVGRVMDWATPQIFI